MRLASNHSNHLAGKVVILPHGESSPAVVHIVSLLILRYVPLHLSPPSSIVHSIIPRHDMWVRVLLMQSGHGIGSNIPIVCLSGLYPLPTCNLVVVSHPILSLLAQISWQLYLISNMTPHHVNLRGDTAAEIHTREDSCSGKPSVLDNVILGWRYFACKRECCIPEHKCICK